MTTKTTDAATLAAAFGITPRRVQQLAADGVLPKAGRGKYPLVDCVRAYLAHALAGQSAVNEPDDLIEARRLLLIEQTRRERRQNDLAERRTWATEGVMEYIAATSAVIAQRLDGLPGRNAATLAGMTDPALIRRLLLDEVHAARAAMVDGFEELEELAAGCKTDDCPVCRRAWPSDPR